MLRWFNDGTRVGIEFDNPKEAAKFAQDDEAIENLKKALAKLDDNHFERISDLTKSVINEMNESQSENLCKNLAPINTKAAKANTLTKVALGVSVANLLIVAADKGYDLYKKIKSSKKPTVKK